MFDPVGNIALEKNSYSFTCTYPIRRKIHARIALDIPVLFFR